jgi:mannan endo-1,4-beta-mannosidase
MVGRRFLWSLFVFAIVLFSAGKGFADFVTTDGRNFILDGRPFYYSGTNSYYLGIDPAYGVSNTTAIDEVLNNARNMGLSVVRIWGFNDGAGGLQTFPGSYNEDIFRGLDYAVARAGEMGLRVIVPFVNNWNDYGGMNQYVAWSPTASSHDDFYTDANTQDWYQNHVSTVLNRTNTYTGTPYREDPTIFAWELANEARSSDSAMLDSWIGEMSDYINSIDSNHMITTGIEGWSGADGNDFIQNHQHGAIDFATFHLYPDHWGQSLAWSENFIEDRLREARDILNMPVIMEEFGKTGGARDDYYGALYRTLYLHGGNGDNFWMLAHTGYYDDGFTVYPGESTIETIRRQAERMQAITNDRTQSLIYDFGSSIDGWETAFSNGGASALLSREPEFAYPVTINGSLRVDLNLPGTGWSSVGLRGRDPGSGSLGDFSEAGFDAFLAKILVLSDDLPPMGEGGLMAQMFVQSGDAWEWAEGPWLSLEADSWVTLYLDPSSISDLGDVRAFGIQIGADSSYNGPVYVDYLGGGETPVPIPSTVFLLGSGLAAILALRRR